MHRRHLLSILTAGSTVAAGPDIDEHGDGLVAEPRLYQLLRQRPPIAGREVSIEFLDPDVEAYSFTFG